MNFRTERLKMGKKKRPMMPLLVASRQEGRDSAVVRPMGKVLTGTLAVQTLGLAETPYLHPVGEELQYPDDSHCYKLNVTSTRSQEAHSESETEALIHINPLCLCTVTSLASCGVTMDTFLGSNFVETLHQPH